MTLLMTVAKEPVVTAMNVKGAAVGEAPVDSDHDSGSESRLRPTPVCSRNPAGEVTGHIPMAVESYGI